MTDLSSKEIASLKAKAQELDASLQLGKAGVTPNFVEELSVHLQRDRLVKVRLLRSAREAREREELARDLADKTGSVLVEVRGNTAVFYAPLPKRK